MKSDAGNWPPNDARDTPAIGENSAVPTVPSDALFRDATTVRIVHRGETYTLRKTRSGKLILTK